MTPEEFDKKYSNYLEEGHYGLAIIHPEVVEYLDKQFEREIEKNPGVKFSQIKMKFGYPRVYTTSDKNSEWESEIDRIFRK